MCRLASPSVNLYGIENRLPAIEGRVVVVARSRFHRVSKGARAHREFQFVDLPAGPGFIYAYADGFAPYYSAMTIDAGRRIETSISLLLEAVASGTVFDAGGSPVEGAAVNIGYSNSMAGEDILADLTSGHVMTDVEGTFEIHGRCPTRPLRCRRSSMDGCPTSSPSTPSTLASSSPGSSCACSSVERDDRRKCLAAPPAVTRVPERERERGREGESRP